MKRLWMALLCLAFCGLVAAQSIEAARKRAEASMLVTGWVVVGPDGQVQSHELDRREKLPVEVADLIRRASAKWRFEPFMLDGKPVVAKAKMSLRVVAQKESEGNSFVVRVEGASFSEPGATDPLTYKDMPAPRYPELAAKGGVSGTVYLLARIDRNGNVADVDVEQVNLDVVDSDSGMKTWRHLLADSSIKAARKWTFNVPVSGAHASDEYWIVRIPVNYHLQMRNQLAPDHYGQWQAYVPGPKEPIAWLSKYPQVNVDKGGSTDALVDGGIHLVGSGLQLATPPDHS